MENTDLNLYDEFLKDFCDEETYLVTSGGTSVPLEQN